ncbi:MAG: GNAT family N-acetyltransferase [Burkholderiales bacterium]|nr:GNAT family N-acetyltransferase [Burkholderiales bacterium]
MPPTLPFTISPATEEEVRSGDLGQHLREFNYRSVGEYPQQEGIRLNAKDADGELVGGLRAIVFLHWLRVEVVWVADAARGQGLGSRLLAQAEAQARGMGAIGAALETFTWQAPGFYAKQGYVESGRITDYAKGYDLITMSKRF